MKQLSKHVSPAKPNALIDIFGKSKVLIGVIHSKPLPGSPGYEGKSIEDIYDYALTEAIAYKKGGVEGVILENHGDIPFLKPDKLGLETVATMAVMADWIRKEIVLPVGINVLANGALSALAVAKAARAQFIRVNQWVNAYIANEGFIEGLAAHATRYRALLRAKNVKIFADVHVKHGSHAITSDRTLEELVKDTEWFDADVLIATGERTGEPSDMDELVRIKEISNLPVLVGSGVDEENVRDVLSIADGCIVASSLKEDGVWWNRVDIQRVKAFVQKVHSLKGSLSA